MTPFDAERLLEEGTRLRALARALAGGAADADDLVQETWLRALQRPPRRGFAWRAWIAGLVRNVARERRRAESRRASHESAAPATATPPAAEDPLEAAARFELLRRVLAHVDALDEPQRTTLIRRYFDGLEPAEIARRDGVPDATVRSRLKRGLDEVRARLDAENGGKREAWLALFLPWTRPTPTLAAAATGYSTGVLMKALLAVAAAVVAVISVRWIARAAPEGSTRADSVARTNGATALSTDPDPAVAPAATAASRVEASRAAPSSGEGQTTASATAAASWRLEGQLHGITASLPWTGTIEVEALASQLGATQGELVSARVGDDGLFALAIDRSVKAGASAAIVRALRVTATDPAYVDVSTLVETLDERGAPRAAPFTFHVELTTRPSARLHGRVVDEEGAPVAGANLHFDDAIRHEGHEEWRTLETSSTDREGRFAFESAASDHTQLVVNPPDPFARGAISTGDERGLVAAVVDLAVEPGSDRLVPDVVLRRGVTVRGTLHDPEGRPVAGARVTAIPVIDWSSSARNSPEAVEWNHQGTPVACTDPSGAFVIGGLRPGSWDVAVAGHGDLLVHPTVSNEVRDGATRVVAPAEGVDVIDRLVRVELRLHLDGMPCAKRGLSVEGKTRGGDSSCLGGSTDQDGRLVFVGRRGLTYQVSPADLDVEHSTAPFLLPDDASERVVTLDLEHRRPRASLALALQDPSGERVNRAWISIAPDDGGSTPPSEFALDSNDGRFLVEELELGPVRVVVRPGGYHFGGGGFYEEQSFELDLDEPKRFEEALTVCPTGRLTVHAVDRAGAAVRAECSLTTAAGTLVPAAFVLSEADGATRSPTSTLAAPAFVTPSPPPGRYRLAFKANGYASQTAEAEVVVGRTTEVVVTLERN